MERISREKNLPGRDDRNIDGWNNVEVVAVAPVRWYWSTANCDPTLATKSWNGKERKNFFSFFFLWTLDGQNRREEKSKHIVLKFLFAAVHIFVYCLGM